MLCQPSPKLRIATQKLFREVSLVRKRREPHMCVAEFTNQVECKPTTVRKKTHHNIHENPPVARSISPRLVVGTQCHRLIQQWNLSLRRSGTYGRSSGE